MARKIPRSFRYRARRPALLVTLILVVALLRLLASNGVPPSTPEDLPEGLYKVQRVVDGDTLVLENGSRIRLIGADTPETVKPNHPIEPYGPEASDYTKQFVNEAGGVVRLQMDRERKDRFDRFLAYVYADDRFLNDELIRKGLATARTEFDYSPTMKRKFRQAQEEAMAENRGIWSSPDP